MTRTMGAVVSSIATGALCLGQATAAKSPHFEVASVHVAEARPQGLSAQGDISGGPGTESPGRMNFTWVLMRRLLMTAFTVPLDQLSGPDWVMGQDARFDVVAT